MKLDKEVLFRQSPSGIYSHNTYSQDLVFVNTVLESREGFYQKQYYSTNQAGRALAMVGYPSEKGFKNIVCAGMIPNFPVTLDGIKNANTIFFPNFLSIKGEMMRRQPNTVISN